MPGFRPRRPEAVLPRARGAGARALARARRLPPLARQPRGRRGLELLRGPADRQRPPRLPPRPRPRLQGHLPALPDDVRATGCRARRAGTATACRSSSRSKSELGISSKQEIEEFGIAEFNQRCRESVFEYVEEWNRLTERIGFWIDLDDPYVTLDERLHRVGLVVAAAGSGTTAASTRATRSSPTARAAAPRSPRTRSRSATRTSRTPPSTCASRCSARTASEAGESLLVWTTTPWTLPGNAAVAVAPEVTYVRARVEDETLILAEPLVEQVLGEGAEILDRFPGADLVGRSYERPGLRPRPTAARGGFPVLAGDFVTTEDGTGLVHIAPAFGEDDYAVAAENGIFDPTDARQPLQPGRPRRHVRRAGHRLRGPFVKDPEVTAALIADLERRGLLFREQVYEHAYPHCWRCGTPLLYYAKSSWYVAHHRRSATGCSPTTRRSAGTPSTSSTAASASGWRTTSTGRSPATATGARRCRSGSATRRGLRRALLRRLGRRAARARARRGPRRPPPPLHRRGRPRLREVRRRDAPGRVGDRHLVRQRRDALRAVPLPVRERGAVRGALPGRLHLRGDRPDPRLVLHAARRVDPALRHLELPQLRLPRADPRPRGPEDVEEPRQRRRALGRDRRATAPTPSAGTT